MAKMDITKADMHLRAFGDDVSDFLLANDIGRSEKWVKARITRLKNCGAWDARGRLQDANAKHFAEYFDALGKAHYFDEAD